MTLERRRMTIGAGRPIAAIGILDRIDDLLARINQFQPIALMTEFAGKISERGDLSAVLSRKSRGAPAN